MIQKRASERHRQNTSGQFSILKNQYWSNHHTGIIETVVRSLYLIIGYGKKYQCRRQRLINLNRYCWRLVIKKIVFLYFNRFSRLFSPSKNSLFVLLDIYLSFSARLSSIRHKLSNYVCCVCS